MNLFRAVFLILEFFLWLLLTAAMTNCCFRVAGIFIFINFVHTSGKYSAILAATRHGGETLRLVFYEGVV